MRLVDNAKQAWRWFSVRIAAVLAVLPLVWSMIPADAKAYIPEGWEPFIVSGLAFAIIVGRIVKQPGVPE